ncbi:MAG: methyltransferase domain-containing protein [Bacteroidetes bacterium]|nr:methyltransferase domain-containing protein [Bacteroidota bacterium]
MFRRKVKTHFHPFSYKKWFSYVWPFSTHAHSEYSGKLEINWIDGRKRLDSENANYSYGSLQRILETGLETLNLSAVQSVLLLGLGGGSVIGSLRFRYGYQGPILAVDIDPEIIRIAKEEFHILESESLSIRQSDALEFVKQCDQKFDLIIVDLFIDRHVPEVFLEKQFHEAILSCLDEKANLLMNLGIGLDSEKVPPAILKTYTKENRYQLKLLHGVEGTNTLLLVYGL